MRFKETSWSYLSLAPPAYLDWSLLECPADAEDIEQFEEWVLEEIAPVAEFAAARALLAAVQFSLDTEPAESRSVAEEYLLPHAQSLEHWALNPNDVAAREGAREATSVVDACSFSEALERVIGDEDYKRVVCAELVSWVLGYRDPVRERVEARQREPANE